MGFKARKPRVGIHVTLEPDGEAVETCFRCYRRTAYWYTPKDVACCRACAEVATVSEVPSKEQWCTNVMHVEKQLNLPLSHWERMAERSVVEMLVRAAFQLDVRSIPGRMTRSRLLELAKAEDETLYAEVLGERSRSIDNFNCFMAELLK